MCRPTHNTKVSESLSHWTTTTTAVPGPQANELASLTRDTFFVLKEAKYCRCVISAPPDYIYPFLRPFLHHSHRGKSIHKGPQIAHYLFLCSFILFFFPAAHNAHARNVQQQERSAIQISGSQNCKADAPRRL